MDNDYHATPALGIPSILNSELDDRRRTIINEFASRLGRPVLATNWHSENAITPAYYASVMESAWINLRFNARADALSGHIQPFALHFYSAPLGNEAGRTGTSFGATHGAVLDWVYPQDPQAMHDDVEAWMTMYREAAQENRNYSEQLDLQDVFNPGEFVHVIEDHYLHQTELGALILSEETPDGILGAIVCQNAAFIPRDLPHSATMAPVLEHLLSLINPDATSPAVTVSPEERERLAEERRQAARQRQINSSVDALKTWVGSLDSATTNRAAREVDRLIASSNEVREQLLTLSRQLTEQMATHEALKRLTRKPKDGELAGVRKMLERNIISGLEAISGSEPYIKFVTRELLVQDERSGAYHLLGRLKILINMRTGNINITNLDRQITGYRSDMNTPHVFASGTPCLGNFADAVAGFIATGDWYAAIELTIAFAESANTDDAAGRYVHHWPHVPDPESYGYPAYPDGYVPHPYDPEDPPEDEEEEEGEV